MTHEMMLHVDDSAGEVSLVRGRTGMSGFGVAALATIGFLSPALRNLSFLGSDQMDNLLRDHT